MFVQMAMIERLRQLCQQDERVIAAALYGSWATGEGDAFSDVECALFFNKQALATLDRRAWVEQLAPVQLFFADDFGHFTAIFDNLIRGEFHFESSEDMARVSTWKGNAWFPSLASAVLVDRSGALRHHLQPLIGPPPERDTPAAAENLIAHFINSVLFGTYTLERGEMARSLELLSLCHRYLLWLARLVEEATAHWPTPSRKLEQELSPAAYRRFARCTARLDANELHRAYQATWMWGVEMARIVAQRHALALPKALIDQVSRRLSEQRSRP